MAGVSFAASEQEISTASRWSVTACAIRWTCTVASSCGGVIQTISIGVASLADSARARFSAPRREARNDGLLALLAIIAMRSGLRGADASAAGVGADGGRPRHAPAHSVAARHQ